MHAQLHVSITQLPNCTVLLGWLRYFKMYHLLPVNVLIILFLSVHWGQGHNPRNDFITQSPGPKHLVLQPSPSLHLHNHLHLSLMQQPLILILPPGFLLFQFILMCKPDSATPLCKPFNTVHLFHRIKWLSKSLKTSYLQPLSFFLIVLPSNVHSLANHTHLDWNSYLFMLDSCPFSNGVFFMGPGYMGRSWRAFQSHCHLTQAQGVGFERTIPIPRGRLLDSQR